MRNNTQSKKTSTARRNVDAAVIGLLDKRRVEAHAIVMEENAVFNKVQKRPLLDFTNTEDDSFLNDLTALEHTLILKEREHRRQTVDFKILTRNRVKHALDIVNDSTQINTKTKRLIRRKKMCNHLRKRAVSAKHIWSSPMCIVENIRKSILTQNWSNITDLLLLLLKHHKKYIPFIKQVSVYM